MDVTDKNRLLIETFFPLKTYFLLARALDARLVKDELIHLVL